MHLLDFQMPEWMRVMWVSEKARRVWQPRVSRVAQLFHDLERHAVVDGLKPAALQAIQPHDLPRLTEWAARHGLVIMPVDMIANTEYATRVTKPRPGDAVAYWAVIGKPDVAKELFEAVHAQANQLVGRLLGYPACCCDHFATYWGKQVDPTWLAAINTPEHEYRKTDDPTQQGKTYAETVRLKSPPETNLLLRWIGVRAVSHLPHSFACEESVEIGKQMIQVGRAHGYEREMDWLLEMLSWPVEWSALHGIAVIVTPVLKISANTDPTAWKYVVQREGTSYPEEGVMGLVFPFRTPKRPRLTSRKAFEESIEAAVNSPPPETPLIAQPQEEPPVKSQGLNASGEWYWVENGFTSADAMDKAHRPVVEAVLAAIGTAPEAKVLDLGAGNGALLKRIIEHRRGVVGYLVEINRQAVDHARKLGFLNTWQGDLFDFPFPDAPYDVALFMPGRLIERSERAREFVEKLRAASRRVVLYAYGDWLKRHGHLQGLMQAAGLQGKVRGDFQNDVAGAVVVEEIEYVGPAEG